MTRNHIVAGALFLSVSSAGSAWAADLSLSIQLKAACAPRAAHLDLVEPGNRLLVSGAQDTVARNLIGPSDLVVIAGGLDRGVQLGQQFFVRRDPAVSRDAVGLRGITTAGWLQVVAVNDSTAIATIEHVCDGIEVGDFLEPYVSLVLPPDIVRTDTAGELDFSAPARVLFGDNERPSGGPGDFMIADAGTSSGVVPGDRLGIFRDVRQPGTPPAAVGEAVIVFADSETSVFRITRARHFVDSGDFLVPRRRP